MQALVALPSMRTVQVPQAPSLQPSFTEVRRSSSRRKRMSFRFSSTVTLWPLTVKVDMTLPLLWLGMTPKNRLTFS